MYCCVDLVFVLLWSTEVYWLCKVAYLVLCVCMENQVE